MIAILLVSTFFDTRRPVLETGYARGARIFKALCDENRLRVLELLCSGEKCACVLLEELDIAQSTLSHHLKILCDSGLVDSRQDGKWTHYSLSRSGHDEALKVFEAFTAPHAGRRKAASFGAKEMNACS